MQKEDLELIEKARSGDAAAISALYERVIQDVYTFIYYKVSNAQDAEDLTQDVLMAAFKGLSNFRGDASFRNWCYEIAKRKIADMWREKYKMPTTDIDDIFHLHDEMVTEESLEEQAKTDEAKTELLSTVLDDLADNYRNVLEYRFLRGYSIKETAEAMEITVSNAKVLQHRALKKAAALHPDILTSQS
jgi:RNA polymerase sigma-70 factor (ECF subfamily)